MNLLELREPVSAWTHFAGFLLAFPATWMLWRQSRGDALKRFGFLLFGFGLAVCYLGSTLYHGVRAAPEQIAVFHTLDYIGIYLLVAGSVSPVCLVLLRGAWRISLMTLCWTIAAVGIFLQIFFSFLPTLLAVGLYMLMGWSVILAFFELARVVPRRAVHLALLGGIFYTVGAVINIVGWPVLAPGYFNSHDLFHLLVLCGSTCHFLFMLLVVAPYRAIPRKPLIELPAALGESVSGAPVAEGIVS
jgi:hemolysin III